jgi:hypothetical protein
VRHAPLHASLIALPLTILVSYALELVLIGIGAFLFFLGILVLQGLEERANARGESLVRRGPRPRRPGHQPSQPSWHVDQALSTALSWLADGRDEAEVAAMLNVRTHRGDDLSGEAREHYGRAMGALREANSRDWVFAAEERRRAREEAERWLWAARAVWLRGLVR